MRTRSIIPEGKVFCIYECSECGEEAEVLTSWHQDNGTPMCPECDVDMDYTRTEIAD